MSAPTAAAAVADKLMGIAVEALEIHPRDYDAAKSVFLSVVKDDAELLWAASAAYRNQIAQNWLYRADQQLRAERDAAAGVAPVPVAAPTAAKRASPAAGALGVLAEGARLSLLDTFMVNGKPIGDITPREANAWAGSRERDARFVRGLTANLPEDLPIRKYRTAADATKLYEDAVNAE